jgi:hypothetical protein
MMTAERQKQTGSFYTESKVALGVANWAIQNSNDCVLEPSFGDGIFIDKSLCRFMKFGNPEPDITAVEVQPEMVSYVRNQYSAKTLKILTSDFLSLNYTNQFDAVIGNPPYVGIRNLPPEQYLTARGVIKRHNVQCPDNGSLWFPFVLHAIDAAKIGGRLAFVLPFEITYTRYAYGLWNILSQNFSNLIVSRIYEDFLNIIKPIIENCKFKIGYVSADKFYFHPNADVVEHYAIPKENLLPTVLNAKELNGDSGIGVRISEGECASNLYVPHIITEGDKLYIRKGEASGVHLRYKCRRRKPWYITPNIEIPDCILSVFGETPKMVANIGKYAVSNSLLCGFLNDVAVENFICRWYNSLTLLSLELNVHSLGGGSFVIIPGEADKLNILADIPQDKVSDIFAKINQTVKEQGVKAAYILGDQIVLQEIYGFSDDDISIIRSAIQTLGGWRNPNNRRIKCD